MQHIYIFSGLGADKRIFQNLDFEGMEVHFVDWITPLPKEAIEEYAKRISQKITSNSPIIIGLSFGGMLAIEIGKIIYTEKIILISSAKTKSELPFYYRIAGRLGLQKIIPVSFFKTPTYFSNWYFGTENIKDKKVLADIMQDADPVFLKWAIEKILNWKNTVTLSNLYHIHGTRDIALPILFVKPNVKVPGAGHLMVYNKPVIISEFIKKTIAAKLP
ncbi:MAG: alpha/beta hydrolase [Bacteroidetes bacterium]|nr:alpha/beta hydrolase [Bacteroidota bacterium]MBS1758421.1 alpha/beta hydrolase [Bacteroidota bacterium]